MTDVGGGLREVEPSRLHLGSNPGAMLAALEGPVCFRLAGRDRSRCRAVTTLLHGNEPSGFRALHRYLATGALPATDLWCLFGAVAAARLPPVFSHRFVPDGRDLNRCFRPPFRGPEGELASAVLERLRSVSPEALIDLHNTSGQGPAYAVATTTHAAHPRLASFFTRRLIVTDLRLGALAETTSAWFPSLAIECGGAGDPAADHVALRGLEDFAAAEQVLDPDYPLSEIFAHPVRLELAPGCEVAYGDGRREDVDVVLRSDLDQFNFGKIAEGQLLGWLGRRGMAALHVRSAREVRPAEELLRREGDRLLAAREFRPLMITTQPVIAASDCLFYAIPEVD